MANPESPEEGTPTQTLPIEKKYAMKLKNWYVGLTASPKFPDKSATSLFPTLLGVLN